MEKAITKVAWSLKTISERQKVTKKRLMLISIRDEKKNINKVQHRGREFDAEGNSVPVDFSNGFHSIVKFVFHEKHSPFPAAVFVRFRYRRLT